MTYDDERMAAGAFLIAVDAAMQIAERQRSVCGFVPSDPLSAASVVDSHPESFILRTALQDLRDAEKRS